MSNLTVKQEKFVYKFIETSNASEAYRHAYNAENMTAEAIGVEAHRLLHSPKVALMVEKLKEEARERHRVTVDSITEELEQARLMGMTEKQTAAAISASLGKAKLHGLLIDKQEKQFLDENGNKTKPSIEVSFVKNTDTDT